MNPQGLATFFGPHLPLYCTCNISCYESSSEIYSMEIKISLSLSLSLQKVKRRGMSDGKLRKFCFHCGLAVNDLEFDFGVHEECKNC